MKKIIILLILITSFGIGSYILMTLNNEVVIQFKKEIYNYNETFDALDIKIKNEDSNMKIEVEGLDLLGFSKEEINNKKGIIKEIGIFNLEYKIYLEDDLVCKQYKEIECIIYQTDALNLLVNNDFYNGIYKWNLQGLNYYNYKLENNKLNITQYNDNDSLFWEQAIYQNIKLEYNKKYKLSFEVEAISTKLEISINQSLGFEPWSYNYGLLEYIVIDGKQVVEYEFTCIKPNGEYVDEHDVRFEIKFGNDNDTNTKKTNIKFSNFKLHKLN